MPETTDPLGTDVPCSEDEECSEKEFCHEGLCHDRLTFRQACRRDRECGSGQFCRFSTVEAGRIVAKCSLLPSGAVKKAAEACAEDEECLHNQCSLYRSSCAAPCLDDSDCPQGTVCGAVDLWFGYTTMSCLPGCQSQSDCPDGLRCQESGRCTAENTDGFVDSPCVENSDCLHGYCSDRYGSSCYLECQSDPDVCPSQSMCTGSRCAPTCALSQ